MQVLKWTEPFSFFVYTLFWQQIPIYPIAPLKREEMLIVSTGCCFSKKGLKSANQFSVPGKSQHYFNSIIVLISKYGAAVKSCGQNIHLQHEKYQNSLTSLVPSFINPFIPGNFGDKFLLTLGKRLSGHCCAIKSYNLL